MKIPILTDDINVDDDQNDESWNQDFDKPYDEYESGEPK